MQFVRGLFLPELLLNSVAGGGGSCLTSFEPVGSAGRLLSVIQILLQTNKTSSISSIIFFHYQKMNFVLNLQHISGWLTGGEIGPEMSYTMEVWAIKQYFFIQYYNILFYVSPYKDVLKILISCLHGQ